MCVYDSMKSYHMYKFNHQNNQNTEMIYHLKYPIHFISFIIILIPFSHILSLTANNHKSISYLYTILISRLLYKYISTVSDLLRLKFSFNILSLISTQVVLCINSLSLLLLLSSIPWFGHKRVSVHSLKNI